MNNDKNNVIPPPKHIQSLQNIMGLKPADKRCKWCVFAIVLNQDMILENGGLDDFHGLVFMLGSFKTREKAEKHAKDIIENTGHYAIHVAHYGFPVKLTTNFDNQTVSEVTVDSKNKVMELEDEQF